MRRRGVSPIRTLQPAPPHLKPSLWSGREAHCGRRPCDSFTPIAGDGTTKVVASIPVPIHRNSGRPMGREFAGASTRAAVLSLRKRNVFDYEAVTFRASFLRGRRQIVSGLLKNVRSPGEPCGLAHRDRHCRSRHQPFLMAATQCCSGHKIAVTWYHSGACGGYPLCCRHAARERPESWTNGVEMRYIRMAGLIILAMEPIILFRRKLLLHDSFAMISWVIS
jgi:hypothetical protein